jgi:hypothetical protein
VVAADPAVVVIVTEVGWVENQEVLKLMIARLEVIVEMLISALDAIKYPVDSG